MTIYDIFANSDTSTFSGHLLKELPTNPPNLANFKEPSWEGYSPSILDDINQEFYNDMGLCYISGEIGFRYDEDATDVKVYGLFVTAKVAGENVLVWVQLAPDGLPIGDGDNYFDIEMIAYQ